MHAHGMKGRKFGRKTDQRRALMRGLMCSLIEYQTITTTLARAKETRRELEKLITLAKKGGLANRRLIIARLDNIEVAGLLVDEIAPQIQRDSGYLKIERAGFRRGDNAEMGTISFVDEIEFRAHENEAGASKVTAKTGVKAEKQADDKKAEKVAEKAEESAEKADKKAAEKKAASAKKEDK